MTPGYRCPGQLADDLFSGIARPEFESGVVAFSSASEIGPEPELDSNVPPATIRLAPLRRYPYQASHGTLTIPTGVGSPGCAIVGAISCAPIGLVRFVQSNWNTVL